jgi:type I restriction enzyme S subunit
MSHAWITLDLGKVATLQRGYDLPYRDRRSGIVPVVTSTGISDSHAVARERGPGVVTGRYGTIGEVFYVQQDYWPHNTTLFVKDFHGNDPLFVSYLLRTIDFQSHSGKSGVPGVNRNDLHALSVHIPSTVEEQRVIAEALGDVDALLGSLDRLIAKKRDLKQAAMQQLLTGKTRLPGFTATWDAKPLGRCLLAPPDYGINAPAVPYTDKHPTYIRITDISENGRFCPDPKVCVRAACTDNYLLRDGELVFARTGASVGKSYLYNPADGELVFAGFLIRVRPDPEILAPQFLAAYARTTTYWDWVRLMSMRSGQPGINGQEYAQLPVPWPSPGEQTAIAEVLLDMDAELAALEQRRDKTRLLKQGMMQELLTGRTRLI